MSDWIEQIDIDGDRYDLKDLQTEALAQQNEQDIADIKASADYSATEHLTGRKWIDGRPTYEKTISCGALPNATGKAVAMNISDLAFPVNVKGVAMVASEGRALPLPFVHTDSIYSVCLYANYNQVMIVTGIDRSSWTSSYVTVEYVKTTDTPQP